MPEATPSPRHEPPERVKSLPVESTRPTAPRLSAKDTSSTSRKKDRSRSKSPFRSFRWKKGSGPKSPTLAPTSASDDESNMEREEAAPSNNLEGILTRKHEWETQTKKATNRSWDKVYVVVRGSLMSAYKDQRSYNSAPGICFKNESPADLRGGSCVVAEDYTKKKHVFRLKLSGGAEYLFQAKDDAERSKWVLSLAVACDLQGSPGPSRAQTLPASTEQRREDTKRRSFFTLKKS